MSVERRMEPREKTRLTGRVFLNGVQIGECAVREFSGHGARLCLHKNQWVPSDLEVRVNGMDRRIKGTVRWRNGDMLGIEFR